MASIQPITDDLIVAAIRRASKRVVMIAPGIWPPVANAIAEAWPRLGSDQVTVILDVDPEICRIGYGSLEGIKILQEAAMAAGEPVGQEPGIRICVFIVDDQTFVFSPTPRQLEAAPGDDPSSASEPKANGLILTHPPASLEGELGGGAEGIEARKFGLETLSQEKLKNVTEDLERNPAKKFDLSRAVNVYNAKIQFVELKIHGCRLSQHKAPLPKHLLKSVKRNKVLAAKIGNTIKLIDEEDNLVTNGTLSEETVFKRREAIDDKYLRPVVGIGSVIDRSRKAEFLCVVGLLKQQVEEFSQSVEEVLTERFNAMAKELAEEVLPDVLADLPPHWKKRLGKYPDQDQVRWLIVDDLLRAFGNPATKVGRMKVAVVFKDVTYDMLNDADFQIQIAEYFPDLPVMEEFKAAKERSSAKQEPLLL